MNTLAIWIVLVFAVSISLMAAIGGTVTYLPLGIVAGMRAVGL